ncbi:MAG: DNA methyltransferase, partial [Thermoplasmata archaeon]
METKNSYLMESAIDWTFNGSQTREYTHIYHDYPARMIPQIPRNLLKLLNIKNGTLFDPYCGSGTTLVEGLLGGLNVVGLDINPLAKLISEAKTDYSIDPYK